VNDYINETVFFIGSLKLLAFACFVNSWHSLIHAFITCPKDKVIQIPRTNESSSMIMIIWCGVSGVCNNETNRNIDFVYKQTEIVISLLSHIKCANHQPSLEEFACRLCWLAMGNV
jgi:hypothetical protein